MHKTLSSGLGLALVAVLLLAVNIAGKAFGGARVDLTEGNLYTLSDGAKSILEKLPKDEPLRVRFYFSEKVADDHGALDRYSKRVRDMLQEFERMAGGGIVLEEFDPEPFSKVEDQAVGYGLQNVAPPSWADSLYFGLVASNSVGDEEIIPYLAEERETFLEYDLARMVSSLAAPERPVLGVLSSLPIEGQMANPMSPAPVEPWFIAEQLRQAFEMRPILPNSGTIPDDVDLLLLIHPKDLGDDMLYAIDQFVLGGGKAVVLVDPNADTEVVPEDPQNPMARFMAERSSDLPKLFEAWGLELIPGKIVADNKNSPFAGVTYNQELQREERVRNVLILQLLNFEDAAGELVWCLNQDEVSTSELQNGITLRTAGALRARPEATTEFVPLIESSDEALLVDTTRIQFQADLNELLADFNGFLPTTERFALAARIAGPAKSAFPAGDPSAELDPAEDQPAEGEAEETAGEQDAAGAADGHLAESQGSIHVVVIADADLLHDSMWVQDLGAIGRQRLVSYFADNGSFLVNALESLSGSSDLISLRGRGGSRRPFTRVQELERNAQRELKSEEDQLVLRIQEAQTRITELQTGKDANSRYILSPEQEAEVQRLLEDQIAARERLREVRHALRKDIESLGRWLKVANIGLIPAALTGLAIVLAVRREKRRKHAAGR